MGRPKTSWLVAREALLALSRGATIKEAAVLTALGTRTVDALVSEHGRMCYSIDYRPRPGVLTAEDREQILIGIDHDESDQQIAERLGCHRSSVWREISNNGGRDGYSAWRAHECAAQQARRPRKRWFETRAWLWEEVIERLREYWSPEQISERLHKQHPDDASWWVSHESIYQAIYVQSKGELRTELIQCLRTRRVNRKPRGKSGNGQDRGKIRDMVNISERPAEVENRAVPGHWEGDLIIGATDSKSQIATLVERTTRFGKLIKLDNRTAEHVAKRIAEEIRRLPQDLFKSLTWDQGKELAGHAQFTVESGIPVYFCDPHSPWQRGTDENWNGLVRQYLPKGTDLSGYSQNELDEISRSLNTRPRKTLDWETPAERLDKLVAANP